MTSVESHYAQHLGPVYAWMVGGVESALERGDEELRQFGATPRASGLAVDLGAGFGMHAVPLARRGFEVVAVDSCAALLDELEARRGDLPIETVRADLRAFRQHLSRRPELVLCMGDTVTHLPDEPSVRELVAAVAAELERGGRFVVTLRDYSTPLTGERRFIPVRSDETRILACFLEYAESRVTVHDVLHEWDGSSWTLRVSAYPKLRLSPAWLARALQESGFSVEQAVGPSGMLRFVAQRV